jgi:hypothetical protein
LIDNSIDKFRRALALDGKNADAMFNLGQALNTRAETVQDVDEIEDGYSQAALGMCLKLPVANARCKRSAWCF